MEPWELYLDELQRRAVKVPDQAFGRAEMMAEIAHDAYQTTTNRLTQEGMDGEEALTVTRLFGQAVKEWLARESGDWDALRSELDRRYHDWSDRPGDDATAQPKQDEV